MKLLKTWFPIVVTLAALMPLALIFTAHAQQSQSSVEGSFVDHGAAVTSVECRGQEEGGQCVQGTEIIQLTQEVELTGGFDSQGTAPLNESLRIRYDGVCITPGTPGAPPEDLCNMTFQGVMQFTGTLTTETGTVEGSITFNAQGSIIKGVSNGTFTCRPATGTGGLAGLTCNGKFGAKADPDGTIRVSGKYIANVRPAN